MPEQNPPRTPRFVELVRVSSRGQADRDTPEIQRSALDRLRAHRPGILVERIEEPGGLSGALPMDRRPDLQRLKALSDARAYDEIRVYAVDRLTRSEDPRERIAVLGMALDAEARIVDTSGREIDPADESGMGEMDYYLHTWAAARERKSILKRTLDGRRRAAAEGRAANGAIPYGLSWDNARKAWSIAEPQAEIVRRIFALCAEGHSTPRIAAILNADGVSTSSGGRWAHGTIRAILHNRAYMGDYRQVIRGETYPTKVPAIVEPEAWERAQASLSSRLNHPYGGKIRHEALCRGLAICGRCGANIQVYGVDGGRYLYYRCGTRHHHSTRLACGAPSHPLANVDEAVWATIVERLKSSDLLAEAAEAGEAPAEDWRAQAEDAIGKLSRLADLETEALHLRAQDLLTPTALVARLQEIKKDREHLEERLKVAQRAMAQREALRVLHDEIQDRIEAIRTNLDAADFATRRQVVEALVPRLPGYGITLHEDGRIEITGALDLPAASPERGRGGSGAGPTPAAAVGGGGGSAGPSFGKPGTRTGTAPTRETLRIRMVP